MSDASTSAMKDSPSSGGTPAKQSGSRALKIACWLIGLPVGIVGLLAIIGMLLPSTYSVEASIVVDADRSDIHEYVDDLHKWPEWSAWSKNHDAEKFADLEMEYEGSEKGAGAVQKWTDPKNGGGELKIIHSHRNDGIEYVCTFDGFEEPMKGMIRYMPESGGKTKITWTARGDLGNNPLHRWVVFLCKDMIADDFKTGLSGLQKVAEADAAKRRKLAAELAASEPNRPGGMGPGAGGPGGGGRRPPGAGGPGGGGRRPPGAGGPGGGRGNRDPDAFVKRMMEGDKNKDGKLAKDELPERAQQSFDGWDANKDGFVDEAELKAAAAQFGRGGGGRRPGGGGRPGEGSRKQPASDQEEKPSQKTEAKTDAAKKTP